MDSYESHLRPDKGMFPLSELIERSAQEFGDAVVMRKWRDGSYDEITFRELLQKVKSIAVWMVKSGVNEDSKIAILGENSPQWSMVYLAVQMAGGVVVPVDRMMPEAGIKHILVDSGAEMLFVSLKFLNTVTDMDKINDLKKVVCFENDPDKPSVEDFALPDILKIELDNSIQFRTRNIEELAAILYTSGTTGFSKGVMLSHKNIMANISSGARLFHLGTGDTFLSVLPVHHVLEATCGFLLPIYCGCSITYSRSIKSSDLIADMRGSNVTVMIGVPLLYEKMHAGIARGIKKKGMKARVLFGGLMNVVKAGEKLGNDLGFKLFKSVREKAGFGTVRFFVSGGGPLDPNTALFFNRLGIKLLQGFGLTETSPITHANPPWNLKHAMVGPTIPGVDCKIDEPNEKGVGEILLKGPNVFMGYFKNEEATREVMTEDGWFKSGDLGMVHPDGYLQIMGRLKNMLVTGGGKNVYPEEIEHHLNQSRFILEPLVVGIKRDSGYGEDVAALIFPDYEQVDAHFEELGKKASQDDVFNLIKAEIKTCQQDLAEYKHIRQFRVMEEEFEKTSTRKVKRFMYDGDMVNVN